MKKFAVLLAAAFLTQALTGCRVYHGHRTIEYVEVHDPFHFHSSHCGHMLVDGVWVEPVIVEEQVVGPNPWAIAGGIILGAALHHSFHHHGGLHRMVHHGHHRVRHHGR